MQGMVNRLKLGLAISIILGIAVAAFPFYADKVSGYIWSPPAEDEERGEGGNTGSLTGVVEDVDPASGVLVVDGVEVLFRGYWYSESTGVEVYYTDLLARIQPGYHVTIVYTESGRWGRMAESLVVEETGEEWVKTW